MSTYIDYELTVTGCRNATQRLEKELTDLLVEIETRQYAIKAFQGRITRMEMSARKIWPGDEILVLVGDEIKTMKYLGASEEWIKLKERTPSGRWSSTVRHFKYEMIKDKIKKVSQGAE